jgi:hypothetical protein
MKIEGCRNKKISTCANLIKLNPLFIDKKTNTHSFSARLVKPRQKIIADSFLFNNGTGNKIPSFASTRRSEKENRGRVRKQYRVELDLFGNNFNN